MNSSFIQEKQSLNSSKIIPGNTDYLKNLFGDSNQQSEKQKYDVLIKPELKRSTNQYMVLNNLFLDLEPQPDSDDDKDIKPKPNNPNDKKDDKENQKNKKENDTDNKIALNYTTKFYIGSITIVGLFILFRMIQKTR
jgi:hypothetical protein